jgi:hypothetical protein
MRSLSYDEIITIIIENKDILNQNNITQISTFIETGTYKGGTIFPLSKQFKNLYTIEINKTAYSHCLNVAKKKNISNIKFYLGDSSEKMNDVVVHLNDNNLLTSIFFLDGHVTDNNSGFTGKGNKDVPLLEELKIISDNYKGNGIIIIDDTRLLNEVRSKNTANADWSDITIEAILDQFSKKRIIKSYFTYGGGKQKEKNDRYIILFK